MANSPRSLLARQLSGCLADRPSRLLFATLLGALVGFFVGWVAFAPSRGSQAGPRAKRDNTLFDLAGKRDAIVGKLEHDMRSYQIEVTSKLNALLRATKNTTNAYQHPPVIYGHVHVGKTGGTSLNGNLSMQFERICGNKGYSFSAYQANEKVLGGFDPFLKENRNNLFTWVTPKTNNEIGFEDCDYVSLEIGWDFWKRFRYNHGSPMELHTPCRDPVDHLMSWCNMRHFDFNCGLSQGEIIQQTKTCLQQMVAKRNFNLKLTRLEKFHVKCFDFRQAATTYMDYIGSKLQRRRIVAPYAFRSTNTPRDKDKECVWKDPGLMKVLKEHLIETYDYFKYCDTCIGSKDDITSTSFVEPEY